MKVVLVKDQKNLGSSGEVVEVKDGYAVNYLIPNKIAVAGTDKAIAEAQMKTQQKKEMKKKKVKKAEKAGDSLKDKKVKYAVETSSGGRTFGSISKSDIEEYLKKEMKMKDSDFDVDLAQPIKQVGKYPLDVNISTGDDKVETEIILEVVSK
jgi:large subunit ribosomal protein L9